ncbi:MAG: DegT/DnrJ/EryC1/StrS family aminotransferase [Pseudomonadota bacterium]
MQHKNIPWASPHYWGQEEQYVLDALKSTWISGGAYVERLEDEFASYCRTPYCVAASNGTTALHMAFLALGIEPGDEIIVPGFGFMAAANVALNMGAKPVFCEVNPTSWCMSAQDIERCITPKTRAIVPIHTYGNVCDMDPIMELGNRASVLVVEDAAEAIGSKYMGRMAGTIAPVGVYSFHATKTITTGEGGSVVTSNVELRDRMRLFRSHGMGARRYWHEVAGHNFRMTNIQAAIGCAQLEKISEITIARDRVYRTYTELLKNVSGVTLQHFSDKVDPLVWAIGVKLEEKAFPQGRDGVIDQLKELGIETRPGFCSADQMQHIYGNVDLPICNQLAREVISLPSSPTLTDDEISLVCATLNSLKK